MKEEKKLETLEQGFSRRNFLAGASAAIGGFAAGSYFGFNVTKAEAAVAPPWPFPAGGLDVNLVKKRAFDGYYVSGCCYGAAAGLIETLREQSAENPWKDLPLDMFKWGAGGGLAWGTICGALNGCLPVINLLTPAKMNLFSDVLLSWYSNANFPLSDDYLSNYISTTQYASYTIPTSVSMSPLCHASVSTWCDVSGYTIAGEEKKVRCARVTADTAGKAAELLNNLFLNKVDPTATPYDDLTKDCIDCHNGTGTNTAGDPKLDDEQGKMACGQCHDDGGINTAPGCSRNEIL